MRQAYNCWYQSPNPQPVSGDYVGLGYIYSGGGAFMKPIWEVPGRGTVSYPWNGGGWSNGVTSIKTSLAAPITSTTQNTIAITDATSLDLTDANYPSWQANHTYTGGAIIKDANGGMQYALQGGMSSSSAPAWSYSTEGQTPDNVVLWINKGLAGTRIIVFDTVSNLQEEIHICSTTATTGAATLGVCYDGRGQVPQTWTTASSTIVTQDKVTGSGTLFISDTWAPPTPYNPLCPNGPGLPGL